MQQHVEEMCGAARSARFASVYTDNGGTLPLNQATAAAAATWPHVDKTCLLDDRTTDTLTPQQ
jgi:hypothetical protein